MRKLSADLAARREGRKPAAPVAHDPALLKAIAEASAWIATLHGPTRTAAVEHGFRRWLAESPMHRWAFEHATEVWSRARAAVWRSAPLDVHALRATGRRPRALMAIAASVILACIAIGLHVDRSRLTTGVGERRTVVLEDGTQVTLNTATRLTVDYDAHRRHVQLQYGEAFFEVAKHPQWPFVVSVGDRNVTALGTAFLVRRDPARLAVTLLEGKVQVTSTLMEPSSPKATDDTLQMSTLLERNSSEMPRAAARRDRAEEPPAARTAADGSITLVPGQRIVFAQNAQPRVDQPEIQRLTAWQQGLINIDELTLTQAAAEMNRYSTRELIIEGSAADLLVSGVFRVADLESFAQAVALTHGLHLRKDGRRIILSGAPQPPSAARFEHAAQQASKTN